MSSGIRNLEENIRLLEEATARARTATREANSATKQAKDTIKELNAAHDRWAEGIKKLVDEAIERQVAAGLEQYMNDIKKFTTNAHDDVMKAFTNLSNIMLYGNEAGDGEPIIHDWLKQLIRIEVRKMMI
jgi:flagellar biosynthesis/type III secretory pathway protein FliH